VAHNAILDSNVLRACCERHKIVMPEVDFRCTMKLSRRFLIFTRPNLPAVCSKFNITLQHHDALSDTLACAKNNDGDFKKIESIIG